MKLLNDGSRGRCRQILLLSPDSSTLQQRWADIAPGIPVTALAGLPDGIDTLNEHLTKLHIAACRF
jgi:hypothetical protein